MLSHAFYMVFLIRFKTTNNWTFRLHQYGSTSEWSKSFLVNRVNTWSTTSLLPKCSMKFPSIAARTCIIHAGMSTGDSSHEDGVESSNLSMVKQPFLSTRLLISSGVAEMYKGMLKESTWDSLIIPCRSYSQVMVISQKY